MGWENVYRAKLLVKTPYGFAKLWSAFSQSFEDLFYQISQLFAIKDKPYNLLIFSQVFFFIFLPYISKCMYKVVKMDNRNVNYCKSVYINIQIVSNQITDIYTKNIQIHYTKKKIILGCPLQKNFWLATKIYILLITAKGLS